MKNHSEIGTTRRIVSAALLASLVCVATMLIKIPSPLKGYLNLGDGVVLLAGWTLSPVYGFLAAGIGSALADIFSGYALYAPVTFVIKGVMALIACLGFRWLRRSLGDLSSRLITGTVAELIMILGYFLFEGILYGWGPSLVNIPANAVQGVAGLLLGTVLMRIFAKSKLIP